MKRFEQSEDDIKYGVPQRVLLYSELDYLHYKMQYQIDAGSAKMAEFIDDPVRYPCIISSHWDDQWGNAQGFYRNTIWYKEGHICGKCGHKHKSWPEVIVAELNDQLQGE